MSDRGREGAGGGYEDPAALRGRLKLGREEYCQRLLTMLIVGGAYPRWNTRSTPDSDGLLFLQALDALAFEGAHPGAPAAFVDEFELPARHDDENGASPDYAIMWPDRLWMVELKTEVGSHRRGQLEAYLDLAGHYYPDTAVDLLYLTPPMSVTPPPLTAGARFAHLTWSDVAPVIRARWNGHPDPAAAAIADALLAVLATLEERWVPGPRPEASREEQVAHGVALAQQTAEDGVQRALDVRLDDLDSLHELRAQVRDALRASPADSPLRRVRPWLWRTATSGGSALTQAGVETGYELRVSRYDAPVC